MEKTCVDALCSDGQIYLFEHLATFTYRLWHDSRQFFGTQPVQIVVSFNVACTFMLAS